MIPLLRVPSQSDRANGSPPAGDDIARITKGEGPVVYLSRVQTKIYAGKMSLAFTETSNLQFDLNVPRTSELLTWW